MMYLYHIKNPQGYTDYYVAQVGGALPVFQGTRYQRGYGISRRSQRGSGLGSILSGLFRSALPMIKQGAKTVGKQLLTSGASVLNYAIDCQDIQSSAKHHFTAAGRNLLQKGTKRAKKALDIGSGRPIKRKKRARKVTSKRGRKQKGSPTDIFT